MVKAAGCESGEQQAEGDSRPADGTPFKHDRPIEGDEKQVPVNQTAGPRCPAVVLREPGSGQPEPPFDGKVVGGGMPIGILAGKARFMDERMERFFRDATRALAAAGWARLWFLDHEGAAVAAFLCFEYAGTVGLYNSGFDPAHTRLAPGIVLLAHLIKDAIDRRIPVFDFLRGEEPYKQGFGPVAEDLYNVRITA